MALRLGRGGRDLSRVTSEPNGSVVHELQVAAKKSFSGAVEITDRHSQATATVYLLEGGVYATNLAGYVPPLAARLWSSGALDRDRSERLLADLDGNALDPRVGTAAAQRGWVKVEKLGTMHQEYLLASIGAVLALPKVKVKTSAGRNTSNFCTLPLPVEAILDATRMRRERMIQTWSMVTADADPAHAVPGLTGKEIPESITIREARLVADEADDSRTVDEIAWRLGLTRAEAVHIVGVLVRAEVLTVQPFGELPRRVLLWVPEEFGRDLGPTSPPVVPAVEAVAEPVEESRPDGSAAAPVAAALAAAMHRDENATVEAQAVEPESVEPHVDEAEPAAVGAEASVDDAEETEGGLATPGGVSLPSADGPQPVDEHVRQLRVEFARSEVAELQEALQTAVREEMDVIAKAAALRARLHSAEQALDDLSAADADR